jgi:predicted DNA-binding protein (UPF0251 family)
MDVQIFTSRADIRKIIAEELSRNFNEFLGNNVISIKDEKISKNEAARFIGVSIPTLNKLVKQGKFKQHSLGHRKYFLKGEIVRVLKGEFSKDER